jgi:hypothetical protein
MQNKGPEHQPQCRLDFTVKFLDLIEVKTSPAKLRLSPIDVFELQVTPPKSLLVKLICG